MGGSSVHTLGANTHACCFIPFRYNLLSRVHIYGTIELIASDVIQRLGKCMTEFVKSKQNQIQWNSVAIYGRNYSSKIKIKAEIIFRFNTFFVWFSLIQKKFSYFSLQSSRRTVVIITQID